jgi:hypothetical protein
MRLRRLFGKGSGIIKPTKDAVSKLKNIQNMFIDSLPYFLHLIRNNIILNTLITTGSFSNIDLKNVEHDTFTDSSIVFRNFHLRNDEVFESVNFSIGVDPECADNQVMHLGFITKDPKFFDSTELYFGEDINMPIKLHPAIINERLDKKKVGFKQIFDPPIPPAYITVIKNSVYGYNITLSFFSNYLEVKNRIKNTQDAILKSVDKNQNNLRSF